MKWIKSNANIGYENASALAKEALETDRSVKEIILEQGLLTKEEMDYILSPIEADVQSMVSCLAYAKTMQDLGVSMSGARIKDVMLLWNKVDRRVKSTLIEKYSEYIRNEGYTLFDEHVYAAHRFCHELEQYGFRGAFRSTYLAPGKAQRAGTGLDEMIDSLLTHIRLKKEADNGTD